MCEKRTPSKPCIEKEDVEFVDLAKRSNQYLTAKIGVDTTESGLL